MLDTQSQNKYEGDFLNVSISLRNDKRFVCMCMDVSFRIKTVVEMFVSYK